MIANVTPRLRVDAPAPDVVGNETRSRKSIRRSTRGRGWAQLLLTIVAAAIGLGAYALVWEGLGNSGLPSNFMPLSVAAGIIAVALHITLRIIVPAADPILLPAAVALNGLGLAIIYRVDQANGTANVRSQFILTGAALVFFVLTVVLLRNPRRLARYPWTFLALGIVLLLLPLSPFGAEINGSRLWIRLAGFSFQPAEVAKICFAIFFAAYLTAERDNLALAGPKVLGLRLPKPRHFLPVLLAWGVCMAVLVLEKDFGTALLFFGLFVVMLYVATHRVSWLIIGGLLTAAGIAFIGATVPHIRARVKIWLDPFSGELYNARGGSYQLVQGLFGMGHGGLLGTGLGKGHPELVYAAQSDFVIATIGEELGLVGLLAVMCMYLLMVTRGLNIALKSRNNFTKLLAAGLAFIIGLQCFIVVGGVTRVIPLTGLALPFLAHGGSALLTNWIVVAVLLRISDTMGTPSPRVSLPTDAELATLSHDDAAAAGPGASSSAQDRLETQVVKL